MPEVKLELLSLKQRVFLVKHFYQSFGDYKLVKSDYEAFYGVSQFVQVSEAAITALIDLFEDTGSILKTFRMVPEVQEEILLQKTGERKQTETHIAKEVPGEKVQKSGEDPLENVVDQKETPDEAESQDVRECFRLPIIKQEIDLADEFQEDEEVFDDHPHSDEDVAQPESTIHQLRIIPQKIKVVRVNKLLEERVEYRDDNTQEVEESEKLTCPTCEKKCKTLKGHKCFLLACIYCRMKFPRKDLEAHMKRNHRNKKLHKCEFCEKFFLRRDDLFSHRRTHTKETPYLCRVVGCSKRFQWRQALRRHEMSAHIRGSNEVFSCTQCPASYRIREYLVTHMKQWHDLSGQEAPNSHQGSEESPSGEQRKRLKTCPHCHQSYFSSSTHRCIQNISEEDHQMLPTKSRPFVCGFMGCGKAFCWRQSLRRHEHSHRNDWNRFKCNFCYYFSYSRELLHRHMIKIHKFPSNAASELLQSTSSEAQAHPEEEIDLTDDVEEVTPTSVSDKINRGEYQSSEPQYGDLITCEYCQKEFPRDDLLMHITLEHRQQRHFCQVCGKHFRKLQNLQNHQKVHIEQQKLFSCRTCGKTCVRKYDLKSHEKVHTDERPYVCQIDSCRKSFAWLQSLRRHERLHAKKKARFMCQHCDDFFISRVALLSHIASNHKCRQCREMFSRKEELLAHQETHRIPQKSSSLQITLIHTGAGGSSRFTSM